VTKETNVRKNEEEQSYVNPDTDKTKLVQMNAIWRNQYNQSKKQNIKVLIMNKYFNSH